MGTSTDDPGKLQARFEAQALEVGLEFVRRERGFWGSWSVNPGG